VRATSAAPAAGWPVATTAAPSARSTRAAAPRRSRSILARAGP